MSDETPVIDARGVVRRFGEGEAAVTAVNGVDFTVQPGEYVAIEGTSGSGKSTLLQILGLIDDLDGGTYRFRGREVSGLPDAELTRIRNEEIGFVFQSFHLLQDRSALENVGLPLEYRRREAGEAHDPGAMLERVGLGHRPTHRPGQLSGGECQRVAIARALVKRPGLVLFDEPTGNLDARTSADILDLLDGLHRDERLTMVLVTHDPEVSHRAERVLRMTSGEWSQ